jgi:hypothetical protein
VCRRASASHDGAVSGLSLARESRSRRGDGVPITGFLRRRREDRGWLEMMAAPREEEARVHLGLWLGIRRSR